MLLNLFHRSKGQRFHRDCAECCAIGRCHWCLTRVGDGQIVGTTRRHNDVVYRLCTKHMERFLTDPHSAFGGTAQASFVVVPVTLR